ncbi:MAG: hypothetical protein ACRCYZ_01020 [Alphaproteobacteria bacterium]
MFSDLPKIKHKSLGGYIPSSQNTESYGALEPDARKHLMTRENRESSNGFSFSLPLKTEPGCFSVRLNQKFSFRTVIEENAETSNKKCLKNEKSPLRVFPPRYSTNLKQTFATLEPTPGKTDLASETKELLNEDDSLTEKKKENKRHDDGGIGQAHSSHPENHEKTEKFNNEILREASSSAAGIPPLSEETNNKNSDRLKLIQTGCHHTSSPSSAVFSLALSISTEDIECEDQNDGSSSIPSVPFTTPILCDGIK